MSGSEAGVQSKTEPKPKKRHLILERVPMPQQPAYERIRNFNEVPLGYAAEMAREEARRCIQCPKMPCVAGCPVEIDIPAFIGLIECGDFRGAIRKLKEKNSLPAICGRVCPQEDQCEAVCTIGKRGDPSAIGYLERFAADWEMEQGIMDIPEKAEPTGKKIAVVGAGPAGLTIAGDLVKMGHETVVYEALHQPGGVLVYGIPEFRLPKAVVKREVEFLQRLGVEIRTSCVIGKIETVHELLKSYDAVFIATGAGLPYFMGIPGENLNGVYSANEFLTRTNLMRAYKFPEWDTPIKVGRRVAVVGAGNVSMDSARTSLRLGSEKVYLVYRRSRAEMPARIEEIERAEEEGVEFHLLRNPVRIIGDSKGQVREIECIRMELGEPDDSGRRRPVPVANSEFRMEVDTVVMAIGQGPNPLLLGATSGLQLNKRGYIRADPETGQTSIEGVYAGGDIVTGGATVILAMGAARRSARAIHEYVTAR